MIIQFIGYVLKSAMIISIAKPELQTLTTLQTTKSKLMNSWSTLHTAMMLKKRLLRQSLNIQS